MRNIDKYYIRLYIMVAAESVLLYSSLFINVMYAYPKIKNYYKILKENKNNYLLYNNGTS